jgi:hypothetical protein
MTTIIFSIEEFELENGDVRDLRVECDYSPPFKYGHERGGPFTPDDEEDMNVAKVFDLYTDELIEVTKNDENKILAECWKDLEKARQL